jgi:hypothetical protein
MYKILSIENFLEQEMAARYAPPFSTESVISTNKLVLNQYTPSLSLGENVLTEGGLQFFPLANLVPIIESLGYLGYTRNHLVKLKIPQRTILFAGMGGVNTSILYWLTKIDRELGIPIFNKLEIIGTDPDYWDITNVPRIAFHPVGVNPLLPKTQWAKKILDQKGFYFKAYTELIDNDFIVRNATTRTLIVGATDIETRKILSNNTTCNYLQITQDNHKLNMWLNPRIDIKTPDVYGSIFLNEFHMLTLKATVKMLEVIASSWLWKDETKTKERKILNFDMQQHAYQYDTQNWLGVPPPNIVYSRHNGYKERT